MNREMAPGIATALDQEWRETTELSNLISLHDALLAPAKVSLQRIRRATALGLIIQELLERGWVPQPDAYEGRWTYWWPARGDGPCAVCGDDRPITRDPESFTYVCARCRRAMAPELPQLTERLSAKFLAYLGTEIDQIRGGAA